MLKEKLTKKQRLAFFCAAGAVAAGVLVLGILSVVFTGGFLARTVISGVPCGGKTPEQAARAIETAAGDKVFTLLDERGETVAAMPLSELMDHAALVQDLQSLRDRQHQGLNVFSWMHWWGSAETVRLFPALTAEALQPRLEELYYAAGEKTDPVNARVELTDTGYTLIPEEEGHCIAGEVCAADALAVLAEQRTVEDVTAVTAAGVVRPEVTGDGFLCTKQLSALDSYLKNSISIDFGNGTVITLTPEELYSLCTVTVTGTFVRCTPDAQRVEALVNELCDAYADDGVYAKFRNVVPTRELIYYRVGDDGWRLDRGALVTELTEAISAREETVLTLDYDYTWYWLEQYPYNFYVGELTFVEISLDNQYMWFYKDGKLLTETPVVTGCIANHDYTNRGFFRVAYKEADCYLSGATWYDHVDYWIPFDGNIGMHDSSWRDEYGGNIYLENGSHGCINTPLEPMSIIFNNIEGPVPVIVY